MRKPPGYLVAGRGRWASLIQQILRSEQREVATFGETRLGAGESQAAYTARLVHTMEASGASVAWLCLPFGPWTFTFVTAALSAGLHVVAECPWLCTPEETDSLVTLERNVNRRVSVHYEYCMLDELSGWAPEFGTGAGWTFNGVFTISRPGRDGSLATLQLGSHLLALWQCAVPEAIPGEIRCGYEMPDARMAWLSRDGAIAGRVDFLANTQPLIQRYIHRFEDGLDQEQAMFGLEFAKRIATGVRDLAQVQK